ncbi:MAG: shikimate dehydrogenase [Piscinibacter sp.]|nr:shikimate dehydrogenase [Piscinibacter sp.]
MTMPPVDRYAVVGNPVEHSQSPTIHAAFARQTGQSLDYGRLLCPLDGFAATLRAFVVDTAAGPACGCNVTVPFKFEAFALATRHTPRAALARAVNTMRFDADGWLGDNTDGIGLVHDIERNAGLALAGRRVLLIGAGGGASGALGPLLAAQPAELVLANRTLEKAQALLERHLDVAGATRLRATLPADAGTAFDVVINATAASLQGAPVPVPPTVLASGTLALDMMYGPPARPFIVWAESHGARGRDGLGMLVEQAAEAFALWRGVTPETAAVLATLRARVDALA